MPLPEKDIVIWVLTFDFTNRYVLHSIESLYASIKGCLADSITSMTQRMRKLASESADNIENSDDEEPFNVPEFNIEEDNTIKADLVKFKFSDSEDDFTSRSEEIVEMVWEKLKSDIDRQVSTDDTFSATMVICDTIICVSRVTLDKFSPINKVMSSLYDIADPQTKKLIDQIYNI